MGNMYNCKYSWCIDKLKSEKERGITIISKIK